MPAEPFVMRDEDRALEWVNAFSESCGVQSELAAAVLASLCGFGSWDVMIYAIGNLPSSLCDEVIPPPVAHERWIRYFEVMTQVHNINPVIASVVTHRLSPSTGSTFTKFDTAELYEEMGDDDTDLFIELFGVRTSEYSARQLLPLACELGESWPAAFSFLGWGVSYLENEHDVAGWPSYILDDTTGISPGYPVYLTHMLPKPAFNRQVSEDPTIKLLQCACLGDFMTDWAAEGCPGFLLLAAYPQMTEFNGKYYCYVGQMYEYSSGQWIDMLLSKGCVDVRTLLELNRRVTGGFHGASKLGERTDQFGKRLALLLSGFDPEFDVSADWSIVAMEANEDWDFVRGVQNNDDDDIDLFLLEPYLLKPLRKF